MSKLRAELTALAVANGFTVTEGAMERPGGRVKTETGESTPWWEMPKQPTTQLDLPASQASINIRWTDNGLIEWAHYRWAGGIITAEDHGAGWTPTDKQMTDWENACRAWITNAAADYNYITIGGLMQHEIKKWRNA